MSYIILDYYLYLVRSSMLLMFVQLSQNQTLPVTLSSIQIHGARHTRKSFLDPLFQPLIEDSRNVNYTLAEMLEQMGGAVEKLQKFGTSWTDP